MVDQRVRRRKRKTDCFLPERCAVQAGQHLDRVNKTKNREHGRKRAGALRFKK
jgi:hypothetical protein